MTTIFVLPEIDMQNIAHEDVFNRLFGYLRLSGVSLNRDSTLIAFKLIEEILANDATNALEQVIAELPQHLDIPEISLPLLRPPVNRGSIGYRDK